MNKYWSCARLNWQMLKNVLGSRWLSIRDFETGYDRLAEHYDSAWLSRLHETTDRLLNVLPASVDGEILDLGCGSGYTTRRLEEKYPENPVVAVDISRGMLKQAERICSRAKLEHDDMLNFLESCENDSAGLIISGWAIGYSVSGRIFAESSRVLKQGGCLAFVVNYADTMPPVFYAYRHAMAEFPGKVKKALYPRFPRNRSGLERELTGAGFKAELFEDGRISVTPPENVESKLDWLLNTGVLAGFDEVLPLRDDQEMAVFFERKLEECREPMEHHYLIYKGTLI